MTKLFSLFSELKKVLALYQQQNDNQLDDGNTLTADDELYLKKLQNRLTFINNALHKIDTTSPQYQKLTNQIGYLERKIKSNASGTLPIGEQIQAKVDSILRDESLTQEQQELVKLIIRHMPRYANTSEIFTNKEMYDELLLYMNLSFSFENNGVAESHAGKLSEVFTTVEDTLSYLIKYHETYPHKESFVHDACLFMIPNSDETDYYKIWMKLASKNKGENLLNQEFVKLLSCADDLKEQIEIDSNDLADKQAEIIAECHSDSCQSALKFLDTEISKRKDFCKKYQARVTSQNQEAYDKNIKYAQEINELSIKRYYLNLNKPFENYDLANLKDVFNKYSNETCFAKSVFRRFGISNKSYLEFTNLDRSNAGNNMPDPGIIRLEHDYYLRKLNVQDDVDAVLAATLGKWTDCCQSLSGEAGQSCAIHLLTDANGCAYVLFKQTGDKPDAYNDEILAQTWAWRTDKSIVFDSVEYRKNIMATSLKTLLENVDIDFEAARSIKVNYTNSYHTLAHTLVSKHGIDHVQLGCNSGLKDLGIQSIYTQYKWLPNYMGYSDANVQGYLADSRALFSFKEVRLPQFMGFTTTELNIDEDGIREEVKNFKNKQFPEKLLFTLNFLSQSDDWLRRFEYDFDLSTGGWFDYHNYRKQYEALKNDYENNIDIFDKLKETLVNVDDVALFIAFQGAELLCMALERHDQRMIDYLIAHRLGINGVYELYNMALFSALKDKDNHQYLERLIAAGLDVTITHTDHDRNTALQLAIRNGNIKQMELLIQHGAYINYKAIQEACVSPNKNMLATFIKLLPSQLVKQLIPHAYIAAAEENKIELLEYLKSQQIDMKVVDGLGRTGLILSVDKNYPISAKFFIDNGINIDAQDLCYQTALFSAAKHGFVECLQLLIAAHANLEIGDEDQSPIEAALANGHMECVALLQAALDARAIHTVIPMGVVESESDAEAGVASEPVSPTASISLPVTLFARGEKEKKKADVADVAVGWIRYAVS